MKSYRQRARLAALQETQRVALDLFTERGFDSVTVEDIASSVGMAASTIYRHFGTKEGIVLWHEYDAQIEAALMERLGQLPPLDAIRDALIDVLANQWEGGDDDFQLRRIRFIYQTEQLHAAAVEADFRDRAELEAGLRRILTAPNRDAAPILAGAALLALDVAVDRWQQSNGRRKLADHITEAFRTLADLDDLR
jgi:AcrR family transcriptional regulator